MNSKNYNPQNASQPQANMDFVPFKLGIAPTLSNEQPGLQYQYSSIGQSNEFEKDSQMHDVENIQILDNPDDVSQSICLTYL